MKRAPEQAPADFVRARLSDARVTELWSSIQRAESKAVLGRQRVRRASALVAALGAAIVALVALEPWREKGVVAGAPSESPGVLAERTIALPDGSSLSLIGATRAQLLAVTPRELRVRVEEGQVTCDVVPDPARRFVVQAGVYEVLVTGTRFTVAAKAAAHSATGVVVRVERGSVEVRHGAQGVVAKLGPGQLWASEGSQPPSPSARSAPPASDAGAFVRSPVAAPSMSLAPVPAKAGLPSARSLFERARQARLAGDARRAAAAFEELVRLHPRDERAGYAAFMLGRLRLDELDDARGAVEALSLALSRAKPDDFFVEDAQARRVEALAKQGNHEGCRRARSQFLAEHPASAHVALVRQLCEERR